MSIDGSDLFYLFTSNEAARKIIRQKKSTFTRTYLNALQTYYKERYKVNLFTCEEKSNSLQ